MTCNKHTSCKNIEDRNLLYPMDNNSLYSNRIYDNQTADRRCYTKYPIEYIEGFSDNLYWFKILIIVLLIIIFIALIKEFIYPKQLIKLNLTPLSSEYRIS